VKIVCAWCDKEIEREEGPEDIRYSVCRKCLAKFNIYPEKREKEYIPEAVRSERLKPENLKGI
jgi:hypothetical protein